MKAAMTRNEQLFEQSQKVIPGGVNSPVRAFKSVGGTPVFFSRAKGSRVWDADGREYIDYVGSWGPAILGHAHPGTVKAVQDAAANGLSFGAPSEAELTIANRITQLLPSIEKVRLVSSGTEATMSAIRLARGFTGRSKFIKFEGCYHGHADFLLVKAGSGALTFGNPTSAGVPPEVAAQTIVLDYNDVAGLERTFAEIGKEIACIIVEPFAGNMNLVKPTAEFMATMRRLCDAHGALLIFDEVMTGFRVDLGCAQNLLGIKPDLTTLGKVIGGGMPVGAFGGRADVMDALAPTGPVYQAGTLSGNPVADAAGLATLDAVSVPGFRTALAANTEKVRFRVLRSLLGGYRRHDQRGARSIQDTLNDELSPEDELRLNVLFNTELKAVRIDESNMTLWALTPQGEASVPLKPTERSDRYLKRVREMLSGHALC